jgi:RNA polymerase sigma-70 factor (ECF subfamily)
MQLGAVDIFEDRSDDELLIAARDDADAFAALYRRYEGPMLAFFLRRVGRADVAADLAAETFAQALASRHRYRAARGPAGGWLFGIARHVLARSIKRRQVEDRARRRLKLPPLVLTDDELEAVEALASQDGQVVDLLGRLPAAQREAVRARIVEERSYTEIAVELRCSESVVRQRVSRGLAAIRAEIGEVK